MILHKSLIVSARDRGSCTATLPEIEAAVQLPWPETTWSMSIEIVSSLGSVLASSTDLKRIQNPHSLLSDFWGKAFTWCSGCSILSQVWVQIWTLACHQATTPEGSSEYVSKGNQRFSKVVSAKSMSELLGQQILRFKNEKPWSTKNITLYIDWSWNIFSLHILCSTSRIRCA